MIRKITAITILSLVYIVIAVSAYAQPGVRQQKNTWTSSESVDLQATVTIEKNDTGTFITIDTTLSSSDGVNRKFTISAIKLK